MWSTFLRLTRYWKLLSFKKLLYVPHILSHRERLIFFILIVISLASGSVAFTRIYLRITTAVPDVGKSYAEGLIKAPRTTNPVFATQDSERDIARLIFSGLLTYSGDGRVVPDLAEKYEISSDGRTYTTTLKDAVWHDGKPLTADDVVFTIKTIQNPQYKSVLRINWQGVQAEAVDARTIRFTLRTPYAPFLENLTVGIIPRHIWESISPEKAILHQQNLEPIGSGPYRFDRLKQDSDGSLLWYQMRRNSQYHREGPYLKTIIFYFFNNEDEAVKALKKGSIEGFGPISATRLQELSFIKTAIYSLRMPRVFGIFFNEKKNPVLADAKIREAISRALNKEVIAAKGTSGGATVSHGPLPFAPFPINDPYAYDKSRAEQLLDAAGWKDSDGNGIRDKKSNEKNKRSLTPLVFSLTTSDWPDLRKTAEIVKEMLRGVGIDITIHVQPFSELEESAIRPRNFELLLFGQVYGYEADPFSFWHSSQSKDPGLNITLYTNKKADALLEEARKIAQSEERHRKLEAFSTVLLADMPAVFLYTQLYLYLLPSDIKGVPLAQIALPADRFNEINAWYRDTQRVFR